MTRPLADGFRLSLGTLTAVRVLPPSSLQAPVPGYAMALAPVAGLVPGVSAAIAVWLAILFGLDTAVISVIAIGVFALTTRGLHLDGLADTADGLAASYDRERALEVMRRGDTGPAGMATVVLVLLLQVLTLNQVLIEIGPDAPDKYGALPAIVVVAVAARVAIVVACARGVPSARPEGLGATVAGSVPPVAAGLIVIASAIGCSLVGWLAGLTWWAGALVVVVVVACTGVLLLRAIRRFGGITGDVIGAAVELGTAAALLTLAATTQ